MSLWTPDERFWSKVDRSGDCWLWTASLNDAGYGQFMLGGRPMRAHRLAWEGANGSIPDGMTLDHLCRVRRCVRPSHLEPVTLAENKARGDGPAAVNARKTECANGHPFDEANTYVYPNGKRRCRACHRDDSNRRYRERVG